MRDDILDQNEDGSYAINLSKVIGGGYGNGWFTNCPVRYRLYCGARSKH